MSKRRRVIVKKTREGTKKATPKSGLSKAKPNRNSYTVRELSSKSHRTIRTFITDLESHVPEIDSLKPSDSAWGAEIFGYKTYKLYGSIGDLAKQLAQYRLAEEHPRKALSEIKVIKVGIEDFSQWQKEKQKQVEQSIRNRKLKGRKFQKFKRQAEQKERKAKKQATKLRNKIKELQRKLRKQRVAKPVKKTKATKKRKKS